MKKQILFILTGLMLAVGAGAVIYETTGTDLQVWIQNTIVYSAKVSDIDSISTQETANAKKIRMWVNQAMAYEADVRGIDSITFAESVELIEPDTIPADTIPAAELSMQVWINNAIVYTARVSDIDSISAQQTANAKNIRVWVNQAVAYEADVRGIDSITFAKYIEPVIPSDTIPTDTIPVIPPDTIPTDTIPTDTIPTDTIPVIPPDTIPAIDCPEGAIPGLFSVAADKRVYFSRGNLQYVDSIWQFAEHQWDYFGKTQSDGHRDLFGWGTGLEPNKVSSDASSYTFFTDWGGNPIANGGNKGFLWETMSQQEFKYLFLYREKADSLIGFGTVNGTNGLIILPDEWVLPAGAVFNPGVTMGLVAETYQYNNSNKNNFSHNTYTAEQWAVMERAGAAFLPAAGYRSSSTPSGVGTYGEYWTSTPASDSYPNYAYHTDLDKQYLEFATFNNRNYGRSVRLVQPEVLDTAHQRIRGKFSVAEGKQVYIAPGNLQYRASTDTWRFAEHQYDTIGAGNANIADDYDGWIDLFGWGTGDKPTMRTSINDYYYYSYHDWGMNPISYPGDTIEHHWRALTYDEWNYLYNERPDYKKLSGHAIIDGIKGFIFLPDDWKLPWGLTFYARTSTWSKNTYTLEQWEKMEDAGAVFLPAAGHRTVAKVSYVNRYGDYWFSSLRTDLEMHSQGFEFYENGDAFSGYKTQIKTSTYAASEGIAVRLVEPVEPEVAPEEPEPIPHPEGAIAGLFSVSETKKVYFSKGNLQYSACGWQFAEHQWDTIGAGNANIETELGAAIDLFGWGTGDRPYLTSTNTGDYIDSYVGWGVNPIINGGNTPQMWATMTSAEWEYLFDGRPNAGKLRGHGCVNGVNGYIFLPDDWQLPYGARFFPNRGQWLGNVYTLEEWAPMERAGAVFLPAAGRRSGTAVSNVNKAGNYWSSSKNEEFSLAGHYYFSWVQNVANPNYLIQENQIQRVSSVYPNVAFSVRLVRPQADSIPGDTLPADTIPAEDPEVVKGFTCSSDGRQLVFAKGNLQYQGNSNTWRFAEHPWDTCGFDNAYMSPVTRKWVDLPGYMRADLPALTSSDNSYYTDAAYYSFVKVPISNGGGYKWWVPGASQYEYIIDKRPNHAQLFSGATVNGIAGLVILPDEWVLPDGLSFVSAEAAGMKDKGSYYSGVSNIFALNTYSAEEWKRMDAAGAVFLPAAGYRHEYTISGVQEWGYYWTSSVDGTDETRTFSFEFIQSQVTLMHKVPKTSGRAVRMIRYLNDTIRHNPTAPEPKPASVTFTANEDSTQLLFAPGNLQYIDGNYYFAQHQYDTLGTTNRTAGLVTTDGYVGSYAMDLFGWGTATNPLLMSSESSDYQTFTNWGTMPIMNTTETWRTPGMSELRYILRRRNYADKLFAGATVNGIAGLIILPDHFVVPEGIDFHSSTDPDMGYVKYDDHYKSTGKSLFTHNTYTLAEWAQMEAAGAVFLPAAGFRGGSGDNVQLHYVNEEGYYWTNAIRVNTSGAAINPAVAYDLKFSPSIVGPEEEHFRDNGRSVRLVRTVAP